MLPDTIRTLYDFVNILEMEDIAYLVGGSVASSAFGTARATNDINVIADLTLGKAKSLLTALGDGYYVDAATAVDAVTRRESFSVLHLATMIKVDVFVRGADAWSLEEFARRRSVRIGGQDGPLVFVASPEDMIIQKLAWYRLGGSVSDRQWGDIVGIIRVQAASLDYAYLRYWAKDRHVETELEKAIAEAAK